jgi:hypothetical protein
MPRSANKEHWTQKKKSNFRKKEGRERNKKKQKAFYLFGSENKNWVPNAEMLRNSIKNKKNCYSFSQEKIDFLEADFLGIERGGGTALKIVFLEKVV